VAGPVVDTPAAEEFLQQVLALTTREELTAIGGDLATKSAAMRALAGDDPSTMSPTALRELLSWIFVTRRRTDALLAVVEAPALAAGIAELVHGGSGVVQRYDTFVGLLPGLAEVAAELPGELLHFLDPGRYWLFSRWMWNSHDRTGAIPLVTTQADLDGDTPGEQYLAVGAALAFVEEHGKAAGFTDLGPGLFGTDVFLAAVYGIYLQTMLRMRLTQEFVSVVPPLPSLVRRLLGVHHPMKERA
jgi:hypothetical protein